MIRRLIAVAVVVGCAEGIVSKSGAAVKAVEEKEAAAADKKGDSVPGQSIARGFTFGEEGHLTGGYDHGVNAGYGDGYDHYGGNYEAGKYYGYEEHHKHEHKHDPAYYKALAIKGLLIPLAGVALLGAAAAFVSNPILLQLGVISSTYGRRKRDTGTDSRIREKYHDLQLLERFMAQVPKEEIRSQEEKLFANYLTCSGSTGSAACLERLVCELHSSSAGAVMPVETNVMAIITNEIFGNKFVPDGLKSRIAEAVRRGRRNDGGCSVYECTELGMLAEGGRHSHVGGRAATTAAPPVAGARPRER